MTSGPEAQFTIIPRRTVLASLSLLFLPALCAQETSKAVKEIPLSDWGTKTFQVKYVDPEQLRDLFAGRSFVMEANRELGLLTAHGPPAFLKEVEDTVRRFDVPPPPPANIQVTVYLLTVAAPAPAAGALPPELAAIAKELTKGGPQVLRLTDAQMMRVRAGDPGEALGLATAPDAATLSRIRLQSASLTPGPKGEMISLNGLRVWLNVPSPAETNGAPAKTDADISANIDVGQNQAVMIAKAGVGKPVVVVVRASVVH
jgi:hypothetical protein